MVVNHAAGRDYPRSYAELRAWFDEDWKCLDYLDWLRWPEGFVCPHCASVVGWRLADSRWKCGGCDRKVSATAGTIFDKTRPAARVRALTNLNIALSVVRGEKHPHVIDNPSHRRDSRRRHRQGGRAGRAAGPRRGRPPLRFRLRLGPVRLELRALHPQRADDAGGRAGPAARVRPDLPRRRGIPGRPGPRLPVGTAHPDPPGVSAVHQLAADQTSARHR